ncbi:hypothetical protein DPMN_024159 [Dreissena polymorpha]|uniref:Uncharacterized protein n=1 Tax=Dreissena polymorpha TaxID=45954 RepID=A0A9D4LM46_DREPO|nr:hypothetical protein DPMN_024159 [Dreissena polymorpha]
MTTAQATSTCVLSNASVTNSDRSPSHQWTTYFYAHMAGAWPFITKTLGLFIAMGSVRINLNSHFKYKLTSSPGRNRDRLSDSDQSIFLNNVLNSVTHRTAAAPTSPVFRMPGDTSGAWVICD